MTWAEEANWAARILQRGWRWTRKRMRIRAAWEEKLQEKLREARRRLAAAVPVGASAKKKTEIFKEMEATLKAEEVEWRNVLKKELASLELDLHLLRVLFESAVIMESLERTAAHGAHGRPTGEARSPGVMKYRAMTESELAESSGEFTTEVGEAQPTGIAKYTATAVATTVEKSIGVGEARPPEIEKHTATTKSALAEPPE